jgi:hypothetical protein
MSQRKTGMLGLDSVEPADLAAVLGAVHLLAGQPFGVRFEIEPGEGKSVALHVLRSGKLAAIVPVWPVALDERMQGSYLARIQEQARILSRVLKAAIAGPLKTNRKPGAAKAKRSKRAVKQGRMAP